MESRHKTSPVPTYTSSATILINPNRGSNTPSYTSATYAQLLTVRDVLDPVVTKLKLPFGVDALRGMVTVTPLSDPALTRGDSELLQIMVVDTDPQRAADIANAVSSSFVDYITKQAIALSGPYRSALTQQIDDTKAQIDNLGKQIQDLEQGPTAKDPSVTTQLGTMHAQLNDLQQSYAQLLLTAQTMDLNAASAQSQMTVVEPAEKPLYANAVAKSLPKAPFAAVAGLVFAVAIILLLEYFDDLVRGQTDIPAVTESRLLGIIPRIAKAKAGPAQLFIRDHPGSLAAEAVRLLRTNVELVRQSRPLKCLAVTSPEEGDGKSTVASNLAVAMAQSGSRTVLIDADLRHPDVHKIFAVSNERGLTSLLSHPSQHWRTVACATQIGTGLLVIPSGPFLANPADLLSGDRIATLLAEIRKEADMIIIDTPPMLTVSDPLIIASTVDGAVLVCRTGRTNLDALGKASATLRSADKLIGVVVNSQSKKMRSYTSANMPAQGFAPVQARENALVQ